MDDRREYYRHVLVPSRRLPAKLHIAGGADLSGVIIDFSIAGLSAQLPPVLASEQFRGTWFISLILSSSEKPLVLTAEMVHLRPTDPPVAGWRFLPSIDYNLHYEAEKRIWRYLVNEQRLSLRRTG